jgi:hypothetical protein
LKALFSLKVVRLSYKDQGQILLLRLATDLKNLKVEAMPVLKERE